MPLTILLRCVGLRCAESRSSQFDLFLGAGVRDETPPKRETVRRTIDGLIDSLVPLSSSSSYVRPLEHSAERTALGLSIHRQSQKERKYADVPYVHAKVLVPPRSYFRKPQRSASALCNGCSELQCCCFTAQHTAGVSPLQGLVTNSIRTLALNPAALQDTTSLVNDINAALSKPVEGAAKGSTNMFGQWSPHVLERESLVCVACPGLQYPRPQLVGNADQYTPLIDYRRVYATGANHGYAYANDLTAGHAASPLRAGKIGHNAPTSTHR
jgi:hypothetical protein